MHSKLLLTISFGPLLAISTLAQGSEGELLYRENCAICHGSDGQGGVGIPLALDAFLQQSPDEYLKRSIRYGRPGRIMPAFNQLNDHQTNAIVKHIRSWQKTDSVSPVWTQRTISGDSTQGKMLYQKHCASCHGTSGSGSKGTGMMFSRPHELPIMPPAITNTGFLQSASDDMLHIIIKHGRQNTPMPSASSLGLTENQINDIVSYLRSLITIIHTSPITEPAALIYNSPYGFDETIRKVKNAVLGMNFRLIRDQALDSGLVTEDMENKKQIIVYFCNFKFLYDALTIDPRVGLFLPCRITIIENPNGTVQIMSINPKRLGYLFNNNQLDQACEEMHKIYISILEEAVL